MVHWYSVPVLLMMIMILIRYYHSFFFIKVLLLAVGFTLSTLVFLILYLFIFAKATKLIFWRNYRVWIYVWLIITFSSSFTQPWILRSRFFLWIPHQSLIPVLVNFGEGDNVNCPKIKLLYHYISILYPC